MSIEKGGARYRFALPINRKGGLESLFKDSASLTVDSCVFLTYRKDRGERQGQSHIDHILSEPSTADRNYPNIVRTYQALINIPLNDIAFSQQGACDSKLGLTDWYGLETASFVERLGAANLVWAIHTAIWRYRLDPDAPRPVKHAQVRLPPFLLSFGRRQKHLAAV
jgi:hypothetical protein